jgi:hypothetical protein
LPHEKSAFGLFTKPSTLEVFSTSATRSPLRSCSFAQRTEAYILALKILAGRKKAIEDSNVLLQHVKVKTRQQARRLLDRYVSPAAQAANAEDIEHALQELFPE